MQLTVRLFGPARDLLARDEAQVEVAADHPTASQVLAALTEQHPALGALAAHSRLASNEEFCAADTVVGPDDRLALIPPVAGG